MIFFLKKQVFNYSYAASALQMQSERWFKDICWFLDKLRWLSLIREYMKFILLEWWWAPHHRLLRTTLTAQPSPPRTPAHSPATGWPITHTRETTGWDNLSFGIVFCLLPCKKLTGLLRIKSPSLPHWSHALVNRATNTQESSKQSKINFCFSCFLGDTGAF